MPLYKAPLRDTHFAFRELFDFEEIRALDGYEGFDEALLDTIMQEYARFCETEAFPLNQSGDAEGCHWVQGKVTTPRGFKELYQKYVAGGWAGISSDPAYGGQGVPESFSFLLQEFLCSANVSFGLYPGLTEGAYTALLTHGTDALKRQYLPALVQGKWTGTMNLTEPQCGTDLGLITTRAEPQEGGEYRLFGTKIFISCGDHDLTDNILHLVLARTPQGPKGVKGLSLFLVPKMLEVEGPPPGEQKPNALYCASIEHKMGIHASSTCVMVFEGAKGWLVGEEHKGLNHMFTMMNSARLFVGLQGLGLGEIAYQNALSYARERLQGRALTGAVYPEKPADPLIVHPDIRRMLLTMKALTEGDRFLVAWVARELDFSHKHPEAQRRRQADDFVQLMTPVLKAFLTDRGSEVTHLAIQVHGGYGYIREYGVEQYARDARIAQIYEGTNGIQALDLVGRKMAKDMGRFLRTFFHPVEAFIREQGALSEQRAATLQPLSKAFQRLQKACLWVAQKGIKDPHEGAAVSTELLDLFGYVALGYLWEKTALIAEEALRQGRGDEDFYKGKCETAHFYRMKILPRTAGLFASLQSGAAPLMALQDEAFGPFDFWGTQGSHELTRQVV